MTRWLPAALLLLVQSSRLPPEASVTPAQVFSFAGYSEGIVFDSAGTGYVSLQNQNQVLRLRAGAAPEVWASVEVPNGHKILPDGTHLLATKHGVLHLSREGAILDTAAVRFHNLPLRGPNDISLDGHGGFYFTDPASAKADQAALRGRVFYVDASREVHLAAPGFCYANGVQIRADGRVLYVDDSCTSHVYAFDITAPGQLANRRIFAALPDSGHGSLDGMTVDASGHLFVAHYGVGRVEVLDSNGTLVRRYLTGNPLSSNVAFGGRRLDELYVTGAEAKSTPGLLTRLPLPGVRGRSSRTLPARGATPATPGEYLFMWAGDSARKASDFLAVIDANPASPNYGAVVSSLPTGVAGSHPHHSEAEMPEDGHLLANGFGAGRTWLFDLSAPRQPRLLTSFGDLAGFSHPHSYIRLANGHVLATFQYKADSVAPAGAAEGHHGMAMGAEHSTGGLVEMDERGTVFRSASAADTSANRWLYPYSVLAMAPVDRAVSTTTDMNDGNTKATSEWVQFWRLSDLSLLKSIALPPGPRGDEQRFTGEPRLLPDGRSVYIHTFNCGLYLLRGVDSPDPSATFVKGFQGTNCGVPILTGHYWLQTVPDAHALVALDIADPEHPREVSSVSLGDQEQPHWIAIDRSGRRVVLNSSGGGKGNRLFIIDFDPASGRLALDQRFRDAGGERPGISLSGKTWPHGFVGTAAPHGTVFSR